MTNTTNTASHTGTLTRTKEILTRSYLVSTWQKLHFALGTVSYIYLPKISVSLLGMYSRVVTLSHNLKIRDRVIKSVSVPVVNDFKWLKISSKMLLHNYPMFKDVFTIYIKNLVTFGETPRTIRSPFSNRWVSICKPSLVMLRAPSSFTPHLPMRRISTLSKFTNLLCHVYNSTMLSNTNQTWTRFHSCRVI